MIMAAFPRTAAICLTTALAIAGAGLAWSQDPSQDDALDRLLEKAQSESKPGDKKAPKSGAAVDKDLDSLLEKIGQSSDAPKAKGKAGGARPPIDPPKDGVAPRPDDLDPAKRGLDEHLERFLRIKKKQEEEQQQQDPSEGDLAEAIKRMREVEQRLDEKDTGDQTQEKQREIVKKLETMIKQARMASSQGKGRGRQRGAQQAGRQGQQQGQDPASTAAGVGPQIPKKPTATSVLAENRDEWAGLPARDRDEMENVFKESALPTRQSLIDRYYISINRKSTSNRGD
jgi:hypothetical protein